MDNEIQKKIDEFTACIQMFIHSTMTDSESLQARFRNDAHFALDIYFDAAKAGAEALKAQRDQLNKD